MCGKRKNAGLKFAGMEKTLYFCSQQKPNLLADVWRPRRPIDAKYIWLPITFSDGKPVVRWQEQWAP